jgi:3-hydroxy-9,10-secoandrosta-1,3,5(10)-triene-9,17-dione monooxygenase reductase component
MTSGTAVIDPARFRQALGHFCTGITVVTGMAENGEPAGFACQSFAALSLDPPLVLFCPSRESRTWPVIQRSGRFCVNVLAHGQRELSAVFGRRGTDKFAGTAWTRSPGGAPLLPGVLTWVDCEIEDVHPAGDHLIVLGRVTELGEHRDERPLLFYRGAYAVTEHPAGPAEPVWPRPDDWI